jgi:4-amino-4-deoxy-L-arabinose transferase-like glycosyltransferase
MSQSAIGDQRSAIRRSLWVMVLILLLAAAFRFLAIDAAPPGWRDDELIEFDMDRRIADGWRPLFITEAEGHEPVYHYLHAGTILLFGDNIVGYKWLPFAFGLLTASLTYALARKMFDPRVALLAAALMAVSFWPIMYARFGVRHIGTLPWMLGAFYLLYPSPRLLPRPFRERVWGEGRTVLAGICLAAALMTYFAGRAVPIILIACLIYLALFQRSIFKRVWRRYALAITAAALIALPMFVEIARTPGAEKRTEVVGGPLIELSHGNLRPAIDTTLGTLGMFTFAGDPESLYNVGGRPVFDWITGIFFYLGVLLCFIRLKRIESGFALAWLFVGIAPAFVSLPAASFSHTITAQPVIYMLAAFGLVTLVDKYASRQGNKMIALSTCLLVSSALIGLNAYLTVRDYFGTWAHDEFVRFQYHGPTRDVAKWLDQHPDIIDVAIGTHPNELTLDPLALKLDLKRNDVKARWFNAESALVKLDNGPTIFTMMLAPGAEVHKILVDNGQLQLKQAAFDVYSLTSYPRIPPLNGIFDQGRLILRSVNGMPVQIHPGETLTLRTYWIVLPPLSQSRLKLFLHVVSERGGVIAGEDREDVDFATLQPGDSFWQISHVSLPGDLLSSQYQIEFGWYNPDTGERLKRDDGSDRFLLEPIAVTAP